LEAGVTLVPASVLGQPPGLALIDRSTGSIFISRGTKGFCK